jgi:pimeloyl-ACP methyl ester carboxylesterase
MRLPQPFRPRAVHLAGVLALAAAGGGDTAAAEPTLESCRLKGVEHSALCGRVTRPLDPAAPDGLQIDVHFAVLPALARNKKPDAVFFFAGGPGQSAISLAGPMSRLASRLGNRRDLVFVDQRGTGRSAPLACDAGDPAQPLAESLDAAASAARLKACLATLQRLPYGDLRRFATTPAMNDVDAVRRALGIERINLVGASYGTRAALEYMRQQPGAVRRVVLDGVAPPDMALPAAAAVDTQAALEALMRSCEAAPACRARHPTLRTQTGALMASLPRAVTVTHPVSGREEALTLTAEAVATLLRAPLYAPALASALPQALADAVQGRFTPLVGLASALGTGDRDSRLAEGMHLSVICAEDLPRGDAGAPASNGGGPFGDTLATAYRRACADWPRAEVPAEFYRVPASPAPVLLLSGGLDPVTPPRHAERVAAALGAKARSVVLPNAGHGVLPIGCMRDVLFRFVDAEGDDEALAVDAACAQHVPRPAAFVPVGAASEAAR